jgi:hypothetical protein
MAFAGAEKLLDFAQPFDVGMLDQIVTAFYTPGGDPTMVRRPPLPPAAKLGKKKVGWNHHSPFPLSLQKKEEERRGAGHTWHARRRPRVEEASREGVKNPGDIFTTRARRRWRYPLPKSRARASDPTQPPHTSQAFRAPHDYTSSMERGKK